MAIKLHFSKDGKGHAPDGWWDKDERVNKMVKWLEGIVEGKPDFITERDEEDARLDEEGRDAKYFAALRHYDIVNPTVTELNNAIETENSDGITEAVEQYAALVAEYPGIIDWGMTEWSAKNRENGTLEQFLKNEGSGFISNDAWDGWRTKLGWEFRKEPDTGARGYATQWIINRENPVEKARNEVLAKRHEAAEKKKRAVEDTKKNEEDAVKKALAKWGVTDPEVLKKLQNHEAMAKLVEDLKQLADKGMALKTDIEPEYPGGKHDPEAVKRNQLRRYWKDWADQVKEDVRRWGEPLEDAERSRREAENTNRAIDRADRREELRKNRDLKRRIEETGGYGYRDMPLNMRHRAQELEDEQGAPLSEAQIAKIKKTGGEGVWDEQDKQDILDSDLQSQDFDLRNAYDLNKDGKIEGPELERVPKDVKSLLGLEETGNRGPVGEKGTTQRSNTARELAAKRGELEEEKNLDNIEGGPWTDEQLDAFGLEPAYADPYEEVFSPAPLEESSPVDLDTPVSDTGEGVLDQLIKTRERALRKARSTKGYNQIAAVEQAEKALAEARKLRQESRKTIHGETGMSEPYARLVATIMEHGVHPSRVSAGSHDGFSGGEELSIDQAKHHASEVYNDAILQEAEETHKEEKYGQGRLSPGGLKGDARVNQLLEDAAIDIEKTNYGKQMIYNPSRKSPSKRKGLNDVDLWHGDFAPDVRDDPSIHRGNMSADQFRVLQNNDPEAAAEAMRRLGESKKFEDNYAIPDEPIDDLKSRLNMEGSGIESLERNVEELENKLLQAQIDKTRQQQIEAEQPDPGPPTLDDLEGAHLPAVDDGVYQEVPQTPYHTGATAQTFDGIEEPAYQTPYHTGATAQTFDGIEEPAYQTPYHTGATDQTFPAPDLDSQDAYFKDIKRRQQQLDLENLTRQADEETSARHAAGRMQMPPGSWTAMHSENPDSSMHVFSRDEVPNYPYRPEGGSALFDVAPREPHNIQQEALNRLGRPAPQRQEAIFHNAYPKLPIPRSMINSKYENRPDIPTNIFDDNVYYG